VRIKRIEIIGFKSFCDRTVVNITSPITSVVGPNGCGKSNIVDAIRWCMGEQSARHLRGKAMDDVIFAGSESRGPASMAEVSLTFEDVGFSQEALQLALDRVARDVDDDLGDLALDGVASEGDRTEQAAPPAGSAESSAGAGGAETVQASTDQSASDGQAGASAAGDETATGDAAMVAEAGEAVAGEAVASEAAPGETAAGEAAPGDAAAGEAIDPAIARHDAAADAAVDAAVGAEAAARAGAEAAGVEAMEGVEGLADARSAAEEVQEFLEDKPPAFDFAEYSEVTITRRLFRDGSSHYLINRVPCRLRDVTDFFLGTGVGTKAYSIIEQGRVGMIVSARPQDRRAIIEEAAGITKFKTKKRAAERKLEQTRQNLLRVSDIVNELGKRMGSLRRQAQKAERYRRYKTEVRDIELWKAAHRFLELRAEQKLLAQTLADCREVLAAVRAEHEVKDAQVVAERTELATEERRLSGLQETIYEQENRIRLSENKIAFQAREAGEIDQRVEAARSEILGLEARREEGQKQLEIQSRDLEAMILQVESEEDGVAARELAADEARQMLANAQSRLDEARNQLSQARSDMVRAESRKEGLGRRREETRRRLERIMADTELANERVAKLDKEARGLERQLAELRQTRLDLGSQAENLESRRHTLETSVQRCEAQVETLRTELHRRKSRLQSLVEIQDKYEGFARGTRAVMQASSERLGLKGEIRGLVADVVHAPERLEAAVEAALGDRLGGILVASPDAGLRAVHFLKDNNAGRSAFVPFHDDHAGGTAGTAGTAGAIGAAGPGDTAGAAIGFSTDPYPAAHLSEIGPELLYDLASDIVDTESVSGFVAAFTARAGGGAVTPGAPGRIEFEDRTHVDPEGVIGRMADLVGFADGFAQVGRRLLGDCLVVDGLERAVSLRREGLEKTLVTLEGDIVDERGVVFGGSREAQGAGVLAQKREIRELEEITSSLESDLTDATARFVSTKAEHQQVVRALEGLRKESHQGDIAIMGHEKDVTRCRAELDRLRERLTQLNAEQLELEERMRGVAEEEAELARLHASAAERIDRFEREQLGLIEGVTDGRARLEELTQLLTEARVRAAQLGEKRASLEAAVLRIEATERELSERVSRLRRDIEQGAERAQALRADSAAIEETLAALREQHRQNAEAMEQGRAHYEQRVDELGLTEVTVRELRGRAETLSAQATQLEVKSGNVAANLHALHETIADRYQVNIAVDLFDYHMRPPVTEADDKRLIELRKVIERMGSDINLTAIDEFAEVSQRHDFLQGQRDDLERAVNQLDAAIEKINRTSRKLFRDTYAAVNAKFQEVFPRLFRGGQARLQLTGTQGKDGEEIDILDAGVEIIAQPPGKKNSTVDQLSGGEKALTAVALIFSIFLIKPSPFCLLDEVDAPLDDVNVDRYNEIIREMTDRSQFIVITHNKRTMEIADDLYGVTMQEPGVSQLVSVNLSKLDDRVAA
jgi:chromosome segregation protein